jgi:geranylgeranyl pyrophosphate synthase
VAGGQAADIACEPGTPPDREAIAFIHRHKTADLIVAAVRLGALSAGAEDGTLQRLTDFALNLGLAFQALDDLLDAEAGRALEGPSCVHAYGLDGARTRARELTADAVTALSEMGPAADPLRALAEKMLHRKG